MNTTDFGQYIRTNRDSLGLTLEQLGNAVGVNKATIATWEKGKVRDAKVKLYTPIFEETFYRARLTPEQIEALDFGEFIGHMRSAVNWSVGELADRLKVDMDIVLQWEIGENLPDGEELNELESEIRTIVKAEIHKQRLAD